MATLQQLLLLVYAVLMQFGPSVSLISVLMCSRAHATVLST
jgi:hypothetical protein